MPWWFGCTLKVLLSYFLSNKFPSFLNIRSRENISTETIVQFWHPILSVKKFRPLLDQRIFRIKGFSKGNCRNRKTEEMKLQSAFGLEMCEWVSQTSNEDIRCVMCAMNVMRMRLTLTLVRWLVTWTCVVFIALCPQSSPICFQW